MKPTRILLACLTLGAAALAPLGCTSGEKPLAANSGKVINTTPDQQLTEDLFIGKWDLDGERTNTANGDGGVTDIPSDVVKDVLGKGWRFEKGGLLKTDQVVGWKTGSWRIDGKNKLIADEGKGAFNYEASFKDGFLYLKKADGKVLVFERDKFFGT